MLQPAALSVRNFCEAVSIGRTTFYGLVAQGHIRTKKLGRRTLVPITEVERFIAALPSA